MFQLPPDIISKIFQYDTTYKLIYDKKILKELRCKWALYRISHEPWCDHTQETMSDKILFINRKSPIIEYKDRISILEKRCKFYNEGLGWNPYSVKNKKSLSFRKGGDYNISNWETLLDNERFLMNKTNGDRIPNAKRDNEWEIRWKSLEDEEEYYKFIYNLETKIELFNGLKNCKCCPEHRYNCPKNIYDYWDEQPLYKPRYNLNCTCPCRHYKRILCNSL